jgi:hypothetical protein
MIADWLNHPFVNMILRQYLVHCNATGCCSIKSEMTFLAACITIACKKGGEGGVRCKSSQC